MRNRLRIEGVRAREVILRGGNPAQAICDFVDSEEGISMIVMSTHGRSGLGRLILGSVAESVLRGTTTPILVVRAEGAPVETPQAARPAKEAARV